MMYRGRVEGGFSGEPMNVVLARFAALSPSAQIVAGVAAISPGRIERQLVTRVVAGDVAGVDQCVQSGLLVADGTALRFRDEYARALVEASLTQAAERELSRRLLADLMSRSDEAARPLAGDFGLTSREREVTMLLCEGLRNAQIAARLCRSVRTIDHHVEAILQKMGVSTRTEAVAAALRAGIVADTSAGDAERACA